jgi:hypothetical protein
MSRHPTGSLQARAEIMLDFDALNPIMFKNCGWFPAQKN